MRSLDARTRAELARIIQTHRASLERLPGFLDARVGFPFVQGWIVKKPAILVYVDQKKSRDSLLASEIVPRTLDGAPVHVVQADPEWQLARLAGFDEPAAAAVAAALSYRLMPGNPIDEEFTIEKQFLCHVGPDAGWPVLKKFLEGTRDTLSVAMYDFNAEWVATTFIEVVQNSDVKVTLTWDDGMTGDEPAIRRRIKRELGESLDAWVVECGGSKRFQSAYHEKVAVRDSKSFWLSSGNWSNRSQPEIDPIADPQSARGMYSKGNREWHVIVDDAPLSKLFAKYIKYDRDGSEAEQSALAFRHRPRMADLFVPIAALVDVEAAAAVPRPVVPARLPSQPRAVKVRPLLTPDNYLKHIEDLLDSARSSVYLQYSYITYSELPRDAKFRALLDKVGELTNDADLDVRIIVGSAGAEEKIRALVEAGYDDTKLRVQSNIHNKGIVVDGKRVLVSSTNWSGDGVLRNRDAGLIIDDREVAEYYERVFLDDWDHRAHASVGTSLACASPARASPRPPAWSG